MMNNQKGFVLVASLVLLSILTLLGTTAAFKTVIETKVSRASGSSMQAFVAANAGLQKQFYEWAMDDSTANDTDGNRAELAALLTDVENTATNAGSYGAANIYAPTVTPSSIDDFRQNNAGGDIDAYIRAATDIRVFELTANGMTKVANSSWNGSGKGAVQQVAVWATSFIQNTNDEEYPYKLANSVDCVDCALTVYALGRFGSSYRMVRQKFSNQALPKLEGVNAMLNAPQAADANGLCNQTTTTNLNSSANGTIWDPYTTGPGGNGNTLVEASQAPYKIGTTPSGAALASNTNLATANGGYGSGTYSMLGAAFENPPYILYSGHKTKSAFKIDYADKEVDMTVPAPDLPANKLPTRLTNAPLLGTADQVNYFLNRDAQLFSVDSYRWAAEQLTCQNTALADGAYGNGIYCSKGEALRAALQTQMPAAVVPVTGRLTISQFQYNVANAIPMFGFVRVMVPAVAASSPVTSSTCNNKSYILHVIEGGERPPITPIYDFRQLSAGVVTTGSVRRGLVVTGYTGTLDPTFTGGVSPDNDGLLGNNARLIVYGSLLIDYFADYDICTADKTITPGTVCTTSTNNALARNSIYDGATGGERLLLPLETPSVAMTVGLTMMINPAMPRFVGDPLPFPTAAPLSGTGGAALDVVGQMNMVDINATGGRQGNLVNLASPYAGYYPWSEAMLPVTGEGPAGTMRLMSRATPADNTSGLGYISVANGIGTGIEVSTMPTGWNTMLSWNKPARTGQSTGYEGDVLHYYYKVMKAVAGKKNVQDWPIAPWPAANDFSNNFCIGFEDCGTNDPNSSTWNNHMGDKAYLMFPKGYMHGWKVALAALDLDAGEWNTILSGTGAAPTLSLSHANGLYKQLQTNCSQSGAFGGGGCAAGLPFNFGVDVGGFNDADVNLIAQGSNKYFHVTPDATTGYGLLDYDWKDIPTLMYSGGLLGMHAHSNVNGIVYTPGPLEWAAGSSPYDTGVHMAYVTGSLITGYGSYTNNINATDRYVLVFDRQAVDNIAIDSSLVVVLRRYAWQELR